MAINTEIKPTSDQVLYQGLGPLDVKNTPVETIDKLPSTLVAYEGLTVPVMDDPEYHEMTDWWFKNGRWQRKTQKQKKKVDKNWQINKVVIKKAIPRYSEWENGVTYFSEDGTFTFKARYRSFGVDTIDVDQLYYLQKGSYNQYAGKDYINELISEPYVEQGGKRLIDYEFEDNKITAIGEYRYCDIGWRGLVIQFMPKNGESDEDVLNLASKRFYLSSHHFAIRDCRKGYINLYDADNCPQYIKFGISKDGVWRRFFIQIDGLFSAFEHNHITDSEYDDDFKNPSFNGMNVLVRLRFKGYNAIHKRNGQVFLSRIENSDTMSPNVKIVNGKLLYDAKWDNSLNTNLIQNWYNESGNEELDLHNYKYGDTVKNINWVYDNRNASAVLKKMWSHSYIEKYRSKNTRIYNEICRQYKTPGLYNTISKGYYGYSYGPFGEHQYLLVANSMYDALNQKLPKKVEKASNIRIKVLDKFYVRGGTIRGIYMPKSLKKSDSSAYTINNWSNVQELVLKYKMKSWYPYFMPHRKIQTDCKGNWFGKCKVDWTFNYKRGGTFRLYPVNRRKRLISVNYTQLSFPRNAAEKTWNY
jgi:hypothetical protein